MHEAFANGRASSLFSALLETAGESSDKPGRMQRLTLRFKDSALEGDFRVEYRRRFLPQVRTSLLLAAGLYAAFGVMDPYALPELGRVAWLVRYAFVCPFILSVFAASYLRCVQPWLEHAWLPIGAATTFGILYLSVRESELGSSFMGLHYDYAGLMIVCAFGYTFTRMRFFWAVCTCSALAGSYVAAVVSIGAPAVLVVHNSFFLATTNVIGMFASYRMERSVRVDFLQQRLIRKQAKELHDALAKVKVLSGLLPICAWCKKVRDDRGYWTQLEEYLSRHSEATLTHGICPDCEMQLIAGIDALE